MKIPIDILDKLLTSLEFKTLPDRFAEETPSDCWQDTISTTVKYGAELLIWEIGQRIASFLETYPDGEPFKLVIRDVEDNETLMIRFTPKIGDTPIYDWFTQEQILLRLTDEGTYYKTVDQAKVFFDTILWLQKINHSHDAHALLYHRIKEFHGAFGSEKKAKIISTPEAARKAAQDFAPTVDSYVKKHMLTQQYTADTERFQERLKKSTNPKF